MIPSIYTNTIIFIKSPPNSFISHYYYIIYIYIIYTTQRCDEIVFWIIHLGPRTRFRPHAFETEQSFWGGGDREAWADDESAGSSGGLINRFYCRFTQYRMEDPIMLDTSCINHRCSGVYICIWNRCVRALPEFVSLWGHLKSVRKSFKKKVF